MPVTTPVELTVATLVLSDDQVTFLDAFVGVAVIDKDCELPIPKLNELGEIEILSKVGFSILPYVSIAFFTAFVGED